MTQHRKNGQNPTEKATALQIAASDPRYNAWVSASAGSGKTKVLVQRVLRILLNGAEPQSILAITYTKPAAAEMQNRITHNLQQWVVCADTELHRILTAVLGVPPTDTHTAIARRLFAQVLDTPGGIKIQTIHSFCKLLLTRFPLESGVPVGFGVLEDEQALRQQVFNILAQDPACIPHLQRLMKHGGKNSFDGKIEAVFEHRYAFEKVLKNGFDIYATLGVQPSDTVDMYQRQFVQQFLDMKEIIQQFYHAIQGASGKKTAEYINAIDVLFTNIITFDVAYYFIESFYKSDGTGFSLGRGKAPAILKQNIHILQPVSSVYKTYKDKTMCLHMAQNTESLLQVADHFIRGYTRLKRVHNVLDFDDIITYTERLFSKQGIADWVTYKTDRGHQHILLDESQDTSPQQWAILRHIIEPFFAAPAQQTTAYPDHTVFAVGDDKQSIYSFQGADPQGFFDNKTHFKNMSEGAGYAFQDIPLAVSFRTVPAVLQWVDTTMARAGMTQLGTDTPIVHDAHRAAAYGRVLLLPVLYSQNNMIPKASIAYAQEIAYTIYHMLHHPTYLPSKQRMAQAGDILVLVKNRIGSFVDALIRTLNYIGVAVAGSDRLKLYENIAIKDILALLQFAILPEDDLSLACVLKSPLVGLTDEDICHFAHNRGRKTLWQAIRECPQHADAVNYLQKFLDMADFARPFEMINTVLNSPCVLHGGGVKPLTGRQAFVARLGGQVTDVIDELLQLAMTDELDNIPTIQGILDKVKNDNVEIKRDADSVQNTQVRIMTIHGAKGLEAPIVIVPDCYRAESYKETLLWNENKTHLVVANDTAQRLVAYDKLHITQHMLDKTDAESKRLLYVAMTRAEDILICGGYGRKHRNSCWYDALYGGMQDLESCRKSPYVSYKNEKIWQSESQTSKDYSQYIYEYAYNPPPTPVENMEDTADEKPTRVVPIPDWAYQDAKTESPTARPLRPSDAVTQDTTPAPSPLIQHKGAVNDMYKRGNIMHRVLENIGGIAPEKRADTVQRYLQTPRFKLDAATQREYMSEILAVIEKYPFIFAPTARAEVPVSGIVSVDGKQVPVNAVIDRLCVVGDTVWVVDFKSNRPAAATIDKVPNIYKRQLKIYGDLITAIYPHKTIRTAVLWTYNCFLLEMPS